ncbi:PTS transporter subunit EIIC [Mangrovibacter phragmitis]|uniref:PTS transporter subunit EIIC n=1 Tax=Mangrovibacter phragmitis TaxID=1691903 RepID=UPI00336A2008
MNRTGAFLQDLGKALMMPISVIAAAGIFLGLAAALQNPAIVGEHIIHAQAMQTVIGFIRKVSGALFVNLPLLFCIATAIGLAKDEKPTAALAAVIGFITFHVGVNYSLTIQGLTPETTSATALISSGMTQSAAVMYSAEFTHVLGIFSYQMSVLGGVLSGLITVLLHNRFYTIKLPTAIAYFGGRRFVPIITVMVLPLAGVTTSLIWPVIASGIISLGQFIGESGPFGTFIYAFTERILIPTGLHHILNETVRFTPVGGMLHINGESITGALSIFNYALAHPGEISDTITRHATRFLAQGKIPVMMFGLPGAALAIYRCARPEHKQRVKALMLAGALASFTTGITEPLEFSFIFVSPVLFIFHAIMTGLSFACSQLLHIMIGNIQGGFIDFMVFGVLGGKATQWWFSLLLGCIWAPAYYFTFKWIILRSNVKTPGRETDSETPAVVSAHHQEDTLSEQIITGLGGRENIHAVDCCFTRLRVKVHQTEKVSESLLRKTGASGFIRATEHDIQVIYGPQVESVATAVKQHLLTQPTH